MAAGAPPATSAEQLADDLRILCLGEKWSKVIVAGISYGGAVAQYFALGSPDLLHAAVFIGTIPKGVPAFEDRAVIAETKGLEVLVEGTLARWFLPESLERNIPGVQYAKAQLALTRAENWAAAWRILAKMDTTERLHEIVAPVLCLAATGDTSTPPSTLRKICDACGNATYREITHGMHLFPLESPAATAEAMIAFFDEVHA